MDLEQLWSQHEDIIRRLYIKENKTLKQVKQFMEENHGFPQMRLHDYEIALGKRFKLKKNFKKEHWYYIGVQIAIRKRQGKETEVVWNNLPMDAKKVRKDVLRNRQCLPERLHVREDNSTLPEGLILRTPPGSPPHHAASMPSLQSGASMNENERGGKTTPDESAELIELSSSRFEVHRGRVIFNQFMPEWLKLAQSRALPVNIPEDGFSVQSPRLFGNNPSFTTSPLVPRVVWPSADLALLWAIFSMKTPTMRAVYEKLPAASGEFKDTSVFTALYNLRHAVGYELATRCGSFFRIAIHIGSDTSQRILEIAQETSPRLDSAGAAANYILGGYDLSWVIAKAAMQIDFPMMRLCISIGARMGHCKHALGAILENLLGSESEEDETVVEYVHLLAQGGFFCVDQPRWPDGDTGLHLGIWDVKALTLDRVIYECCPRGRRRLHRLIDSFESESKTHVNLAGVLTFAQEGPGALKAYLRFHEHHGDKWDSEILERSLSEAASLGEIKTVSSLLEAGVDPNVPSRSRRGFQGRTAASWSAMARAAMAGNPDMLRLLLAHKRLDVRSFVESITSGSRMRTLFRAPRGKFTPESLFLSQHEHEGPGCAPYDSEDSRRSEAMEIICTIAKYHNMDIDAHILQAVLGFSTRAYGITVSGLITKVLRLSGKACADSGSAIAMCS
ncbi:hypothetical protein diail_5695 [Diaporthe ilicicola]|nr:hypothetical protein diail_5695 [Diaporthe ilicicola]